MKRTALCLLLMAALFLLCGCSGGQEIEDCLFVISMAVDPAVDGNLTVTVKALSGTQEAAAPQAKTQQGEGGEGEAERAADNAEQTEPGYVVLSATAKSCLSALHLLGATTPRTVNLSQLQEIVLARPLAETDATLSILREIYALFEANGAAVVVVTPDNAGDFIRRQYAMFGVRLSQYLQVLFEHFETMGTIPSGANLAAIVSAMQSGAQDAAAVYAAQNDFGATLALGGDVTDRLPGHLPRTSPARNEYLGSAVFSGPRMVGTLTGEETTLLRLLRGEATATSFVLDGAMMQVKTRTRVTRRVERDAQGDAVLAVSIRMNLARSAGSMTDTAAGVAARVEQGAAHVIAKLQAMGSDAAGFGALAMRRFGDIAAWEAYDWPSVYARAGVRAAADIRID